MLVSDAEAVSRAIALKEKIRQRLMAIPGVHGIGVGCKFVGGQLTRELAIMVYVYKKRAAAELPAEEIIPAEIEGIKTDVREADLGHRCEDTARYRPLIGGIKIEWTKVEHPTPNSTTTTNITGTLGCLARSKTTGKTVALTAAHVVTACEDPAAVAAAGRRIGQPDDSNDYSCCSKCWATVFGTVIDGSKDPDSAIIQLDKCVDGVPQIQDLGPVNGALSTPDLNNLGQKPVKIRGYKTAEVRQGFVIDVSHDDFLPCSEGSISDIWSYHQALTVHPDPPNSQFGQKGDSGSPVLDMNNNVVGLFFGLQMINGVSTPVVSRIDRILSTYQARWNLEILTTANTLMAPAAAMSSVATPHAFAATTPAAVTETFQPTEEDLHLLSRARDEVLAIPAGQRLSQLVAKHVPEIQNLIRTKKRIAAVWQRLAAPEVLQATLAALRAPDRPFGEFIAGMSFPERLSAMSRALMRYGSKALVDDLKLFSGLAAELPSKSYAQVVEWVKNIRPSEIIQAEAPSHGRPA